MHSIRNCSLVVSSVLALGCGAKSGVAETMTSTATDASGPTTGAETSGSTAPDTASDTVADSTPPSDTSSADDSDDDDTGVSFVLRPDAMAASECDPKAQDCPDGEKCTAWSNDGGSAWNANRCVPVTGDGVAGDECMAEGSGVSGIDDCAAGFMCWDIDGETNMGVCVAFCDPNDICPPDTVCAIQNDGVLPICIASCDPLLQDCEEGQGCYAKDGANGQLICIPDASGDGGADGAPCEFDNACDPGLVCIGGSTGCTATWCCTPWCDLEAPNTCPGAGEECVQHFDDPPPGTESVGICVVPS